MKKKISFIITICLISVLLYVFTNLHSDADAKVTKSGFYFDTIISITLYGTADESYIDQCFDMASQYENLLSNTIDDSDISRINANAGKSAVEVSDDTRSEERR